MRTFCPFTLTKTKACMGIQVFLYTHTDIVAWPVKGCSSPYMSNWDFFSGFFQQEVKKVVGWCDAGPSHTEQQRGTESKALSAPWRGFGADRWGVIISNMWVAPIGIAADYKNSQQTAQWVCSDTCSLSTAGICDELSCGRQTWAFSMDESARLHYGTSAWHGWTENNKFLF